MILSPSWLLIHMIDCEPALAPIIIAEQAFIEVLALDEIEVVSRSTIAGSPNRDSK